MKVACEKCNKILNGDKWGTYTKIQWKVETIVLCDKCFKEFYGWVYGRKEETDK